MFNLSPFFFASQITGLGSVNLSVKGVLSQNELLACCHFPEFLALLHHREPSARNMRQALASIILRLLGSRVVYEDADLSLPPPNPSALKWDAESSMDACVTSLFDRPGESLFERLLSIFHALLSSCKPSWLKPKSAPKSTVKSPRDFPAFDREAAESMQVSSSCLCFIS